MTSDDHFQETHKSLSIVSVASMPKESRVSAEWSPAAIHFLPITHAVLKRDFHAVQREANTFIR